MTSNKIYSFKNGTLTIHPETIEYKSRNGQLKRSMSRMHIGGANKEPFRVLERDVIQYGFLSLLIAIITLVLAFKLDKSSEEGLNIFFYISFGFFIASLFLVLGNLFIDGLLGIRITTEVCLSLFGVKGYKITIQNNSGGDHVEFFILTKEIFNVDEIINYKLNTPSHINADRLSNIEKLYDLHTKGFITDDELRMKKEQILSANNEL